MKTDHEKMTRQANFSRYQGQGTGFYESFFLRANHPRQALAFWIRYTVFEPGDKTRSPMGELWATWFDGESGRHVSVKDEFPVDDCRFDNDRFRVSVGEAVLDDRQASGQAGGDDRIQWELTYSGDNEPLLLLPPKLYEAGFPKAKALVGLPLAVFSGTITVNGEVHDVGNWVGSQNHNWGVKHTDSYAWGQVAGFDDHPDTFLELATARVKIGPVYTPRMTLLVLRHEGREYRLNSIIRSLRAYGRFEFFTWNFQSESPEVAVDGTIAADKADFVGLRYHNPPGGIKHCLNTKIASCRLTLHFKKEDRRILLTTGSRAAFEIFTDDHNGHGVPVYA
ncbi:MAG: hypothetical protein ACOCPQ_02660 [Desulfosudaceae bacterium]